MLAHRFIVLISFIHIYIPLNPPLSKESAHTHTHAQRKRKTQHEESIILHFPPWKPIHREPPRKSSLLAISPLLHPSVAQSRRIPRV